MNTLDPNVLIEISTKIASIDERTKSLQQADLQAQVNADHRHRNVMTAIENFVPRKEIEHMHAATRTYAETLSHDAKAHCDANRELVVARVSKLEDAIQAIRENGVWLKRTLIGSLITILTAGGSYLFHLIFTSKLPLP